MCCSQISTCHECDEHPNCLILVGYYLPSLDGSSPFIPQHVKSLPAYDVTGNGIGGNGYGIKGNGFHQMNLIFDWIAVIAAFVPFGAIA